MSNTCRTFAGGLSESEGSGLGLGMIQLHFLHPKAVKVLFSSQTRSLAIVGRFSHKVAELDRYAPSPPVPASPSAPLARAHQRAGPGLVKWGSR